MILTIKIGKRASLHHSFHWTMHQLKSALIGQRRRFFSLGGRWLTAPTSSEWLRSLQLQYLLFLNWHVAWPNFLPRDKRKEGTTWAQDKAVNAIKCNTLDRSLETPALTHTHTRLSPPVTTSLEEPCSSCYLSLFHSSTWVSTQGVSKVWKASRNKMRRPGPGLGPVLCIS